MSRRTKVWFSVAVLVVAAGGVIWLLQSLPSDDEWDVVPDQVPGREPQWGPTDETTTPTD